MNTGGRVAVRIAPWDAEREVLRRIRTVVFIEEQNVPQHEEWDEFDETSTHFLVTLDDEPVACGRLMPSGKVGRMAVLREHRGKGLGLELLRFIERYARRQGFEQLYLHAQSYALPFYERGGYVAYGEHFLEADIDHRAMRLSLLDGPVRYPGTFSDFAIAVARSARRELFIQSPDLDRQVFADAEFCEVVSALARSSRYVQICILVMDSDDLRRRSHPLVELARRLPSRFKLQLLTQHPELSRETLLLADRRAVLQHGGSPTSTGIYRPDDRAFARRRCEQFKVLWQVSRPDVELRTLSI